jgi:uncharacterized protein YfaS (alpha-2-macroglobulin family)
MDTIQNSSKLPTFLRLKLAFQKIVTRIKNKPHFLFLITMLLLNLVLGSMYFNLYDKKHSKVQVQDSYKSEPVLRVLSAYVDRGALPDQFTLKFNDTVNINHLDNHVVFSPKIAGKWVADEDRQFLYRYKFDKKFKGTYLSIKIDSGLRSSDGVTMNGGFDQFYNISDNSRFSQNARVSSFAAGDPIPFIYEENNVTVYKSDAQKMLNYLTYSTKEDTRRSRYSGTFIEKYVEHSDKNKLQDLNINQEDSTLLLDPGIYYIDDNSDKPFFVVISNYGAVLRQDDQKIVLGAFNLQSGVKIDDAVTFGLYNLNDQATLFKDFVYTQENNTVNFKYPDRLDAVIGIYNDEVFFIPVEVLTSFADIQVSSNLDTDSQIFLYTDRPIYQPGDTIFVKGIARQNADALYKLPPKGTKVYVRFNAYGKREAKILEVFTDEYGAFSTNYEIPEDETREYSNVSASVKPFDKNNYSYSSAEFSVLKYVKPEFEIKTSVAKDDYLQSDKLNFNVSGNFFNGKPLVNKKINYTIYSDNFYEVEKVAYNKNFNIKVGGMCGGGGGYDWFGREYKTGSVTLDSNGEALVQTDWDEESIGSQKVTLIAKVVDNSANILTSAATTIVHAAEFNIFFIPSANKYSQGEEVVAPFYVESLTGEKVTNKSFTYNLFSYEHKNNEKSENVSLTGTTSTDGNGKGIIKFIIPEDIGFNYKELKISGTDSKENSVSSQKSISIVKKDAELVSNTYQSRDISATYLRINSNQNSFQVGETIILNINSPRELDTLFSLERGRIYNQQMLHLKEGDNVVEFTVDEKLSPSITAVFSFFSEGSYYTEGLSLNVPAMHKLMTIDLSLDKPQYSTTDTNAELKISTRDANGAPVAAQMSVGIVDKAIYGLRKSATPKIHSSYYYFRPRRTNASSSLTKLGIFEGGGGGGGGGEGLGSNADVLYWNPTARTGISGETTLLVPLLGHETTWKVQVLGTTLKSDVGQADTEFIVTDTE